ncbi:CPBP family intramembrane glutamic endopeptidase [Dendrosporobacter sp. 1207_IL3150]|uniref:CPBP family intramembrane glutamic endopeptidase n=1 Tax=Dendrosporobacter sp. 1207_IL3150 TaxID=3084054 RepID=UPI002FDB1636
MLSGKVPWNLKEVLSVHVLRLVVGLLLVRLIYPVLFNATSFVVEITDRLIVIALVWMTVRKYQRDLGELGITFKNLGRNVAMGIGAGVLLLGISLYSERIYTTLLFVTPNQHPLVAQVQSAASLQQLVIPLFLAGFAAPVAEEVLYRFFTFLPLKQRWGLWGGALLSSAIFALMHFNAYWLAEIIVVGVGLTLLFYWTGSLLSSIVAHSLINTSKVLMIYFGIPLI